MIRRKYTAFGHKLANIKTDNVEYVIKDKEGIAFGYFKFRYDRDKALKRFCFGFPSEAERVVR